MKIKSAYVLTIIAVLFSASTFAGTNNAIVIGSGAGAAGATVDIDVTWTEGGTAGTNALQIDIAYDLTNLSFVSCTLNAPYSGYNLASCNFNEVAEVVRIGLIDNIVSPGPIPSGTLGTITFQIDGAAPVGSYPLTVPFFSTGDDPDPTDVTPGNIEVQDVPVPNYTSTPPPGSTIDFGAPVEGSGDVDMILNIGNNGIPDGGTMDVDCDITNNPGGAYSITPADGLFTLDIGESDNLTVTCDTTNAGDFTGGTLSCAHTAPNSPNPAIYTLDCFVTGDPVYGSVPAPGDPIAFGSFPQNNPAPDQTLLINNDAGEAGSLLAGDCSLMGGGTPIALVGGPTVSYSVMQGAADAVITLSCDTTQAVGDYNDTLVCTNNDPALGMDATYPVSCEILPPDPGVWGSNPPSGSTINLTPEGPVLVDTDLTNAGQLEVFNAGEEGDADIAYNCTIVSGSTEISQNPDPALGTLVAGGASDLINYSCDSSAAGSFSANVECAWSAPIEGPDGQGVENYTVTCDVREPFSEVVETPTSGTPQTAEVGPGESHVFTFTFEEIHDEGLDASLDDCVLGTGTDFAITDPGSFPQPIPSGGTETVDVTFTDPGVGDTFTDQLSCSYTHQPPPTGNTDKVFVSWPLEVNVTGRNVTFLTSKNFSDDNPAEVEVTLSCNTGLPLQQTTTISEGDPVNFVVVDFEPGTMNCSISEVVPAGYQVNYFADIGEDGVAANVFADEDGCHYEGLESADFICEINNDLLPVTVTVNKEWVDDNPAFNLPTFVEVTLWCTHPIVNGFNQPNGLLFSQEQFIDPANPGVFNVLPDWDGSTECFVTEEVDAGVLGDVSDCESIALAPGVDGECTIVNTRLFEGIPTLSQYGLLLMALLMLGMGALAFRRYV